MSFQDELNRKTKTEQSLRREELKDAIIYAKMDYESIKESIFDDAKRANYEICNGKKKITGTINLHKKITNSIKSTIYEQIENKTIFNRRGDYVRSISIEIIDEEYYNTFLSSLTKLCSKDGITCKIVMSYNKKIIEVPGFTRDIGGDRYLSHHIKGVLCLQYEIIY